MALPNRHSRDLRGGWRLLAMTCLGLSLLGAGLGRAAAPAAPVTATTPAPRFDKPGWKERHEALCAQAKAAPYDLVFIGDSITERYYTDQRSTWDRYYGARKTLNLGFNGDATEHVLWRLDHGELAGQRPKLIVLLIGSNNTGKRLDPPADIAAGVQAILARLAALTPTTPVLLLGILPRQEKATEPWRVNNAAANVLLAKLADGQRVTYLDVGAALVAADGTLRRDLLPDLTHPNAAGYVVLSTALEPRIRQALGEAPVAP